MSSIKLSVSHIEGFELGEKEKNLQFHFYIIPYTQSYKIIHNDKKTFDVDLVLSKLQQNSFSIAIDAYILLLNNDNDNVLSRIASCTFMPTTHDQCCTFVNAITQEKRGSMQLHLFKKKEQASFDVYEIFDRSEKAIHSDIMYARSLFKHMKPIDNFIERVHAPFFQTRFGRVLPGWSYWLCKLNVTENFYDHLMQNMYWRYVKTTQLSDIDHVALFFTGVTSVIQSYPYISDTTYSIETKHQKSYESFDNYFVRGGGDCEDSSRAIVQLVRTFQDMQLQNSRLQKLQKLIQMYIPCSVLSMVTNASAENWNDNNPNNKMAHMSCQMIPKYIFFQMIAKCTKNTEKQIQYAQLHANKSSYLPSFRLEGTAVTLPLSYDENIVIRRPIGIEKTIVQSPLMDLLQSYPPVRIQPDHPFYKVDSHMYTDFFLNQDFECGVFTFVSHKDQNVWGKPFAETLSHHDDVALWCQPIPHFHSTIKDIKHIVTALHPSPTLSVDNRLLDLHSTILNHENQENPDNKDSVIALCAIKNWKSINLQQHKFQMNVEGFNSSTAKICLKIK